VTVNLLMRSPDNNISTATQSVTFDNGTFTASDRRLYQVYSATVAVRNRLPAM
jgi:type IV pilus assembly protein PilW